MRLRLLSVAVPLLMLVYGVALWFDGLDSGYGSGAAWNIGPLTAVLLGVGLVPVGLAHDRHRPSGGSR